MARKKVILGGIIFTFLVGLNIKIVDAQTSENLTIPTKEVIERLARIEENQKSIQRQIDDTNRRIDDMNERINERIDDVNIRIDDLKGDIRELKSFVLWGFMLMCTGMFALCGFVLWDRRTALLPTIHEMKELAQQGEKVEKVLREYAGEDTKFAKAMRAAGLL
ncbi:MAG: hypothetical protein AB1567_05250 [bacterium]